MGQTMTFQNVTFPIKRDQICYLVDTDFMATGEIQHVHTEWQCQWFRSAIEDFTFDVLIQRLSILEAKKMFMETDYDYLKKRFPRWKTEDILDIKAQFQAFDRNYDALIDFAEMCDGLDRMDDDTPMEERLKIFTTIDTDDSGAINFEEYLTVLDKCIKQGVSHVFKKAAQYPSTINRLTIRQQIENGLF